MITQAIGFANTFYTLWSIDTKDNYFQDAYGNYWKTGVTTTYTYHKNVSTDISKVKELYPSLEIIEELRGATKSWECTKESIEDVCPNIMKYGKYKGQDLNLIVESDFDYVLWLAKECSNSNAKYAMTIEAVKNHIIAKEEESNKFMNENIGLSERLSSEGVIEFVADRNFKMCSSECANIALEIEGKNITFWSADCKKMYYNGITYALPIIDGKAKKIKGKTIRMEFTKQSNEQMQYCFNTEDIFHFAITKLEIL